MTDRKRYRPTSTRQLDDTTAPLADKRQQIGATVVLLISAGLFALVARRVRSRRAEPFDRTVQARIRHNRMAALDAVARPVMLLSLPVIAVGATAALVWRLHREGRQSAATALAITPALAAALGQSFTTLLAQRNPPDKLTRPASKV
jgi:hypothetical protein